MRIRFAAPIIALSAVALSPASAKTPPSPEQRIDRLEKQVRQVQKQLFPKGQPADTAGFSDDPAATQGSVSELYGRIDALERQLTELIRTSEENGNRLGVIEVDLARLRADQDNRFRALETAPASAATEPAMPATAPPPALRPKVETAPPPAPRPKVETPAPRLSVAPSSSAADPGEETYVQGFDLWQAKRYGEAVTVLRAMVSAFPGHRRVSWANNLTGRALLDSGQPRPAAEALLANYRGDPKGERAADSLFYLGQSLVKLGQPQQACKAYAELGDVYATTMRTALRAMIPAALAEAKCK